MFCQSEDVYVYVITSIWLFFQLAGLVFFKKTNWSCWGNNVSLTDLGHMNKMSILLIVISEFLLFMLRLILVPQDYKIMHTRFIVFMWIHIIWAGNLMVPLCSKMYYQILFMGTNLASSCILTISRPDVLIARVTSTSQLLFGYLCQFHVLNDSELCYLITWSVHDF